MCFTICKTYEELQSGHRHRRKFFEEIKNDMEKSNEREQQYLKNFKTDISNCEGLDMDKVFHLFAHVSNFELKPLRSYFNDEIHCKSDQWSLKKLSKISKKWFLKDGE